MGDSLLSGRIVAGTYAHFLGVVGVTHIARAQNTSDDAWLNESCPRSLGPSLWSDCIQREKQALQSSWPNLNLLDERSRQWVFEACPRSLGPSLTLDCVRREEGALQAPGWPELSALPPDQRSWLEEIARGP